MFRPLIVFLLLTVSFFGLPSAFADSQNWQITRSEGVVRVLVPGSAMAKARPEMDLPTGSLITTGNSGSVVLQRGGQQISMGPDSRLTLAANSSDMTQIRQDAGAVLYEVDRRQVPHFRVETALLAAVVKGTGFTVSAGPDTDVVHVTHGLVEVVSLNNGNAIGVQPGETAMIARSEPGQVKVQGPKDASAAPEVMNVPQIDYAEASGNIVQGPAQGAAIAAQARGNGNGNRGTVSSVAAADPGASSKGQGAGSSAAIVAASLSGRGNSNAGGVGNANGGGAAGGNPGGSGNANGGGAAGGNPGGSGNANGGGAAGGNPGGSGNANGGGAAGGNPGGSGNANGGGAAGGDTGGAGNANGGGNAPAGGRP